MKIMFKILFKHQKHHILTSELYSPARSFDERNCIYETCHKSLSKIEIPCRVVFNKTSLDSRMS